MSETDAVVYRVQGAYYRRRPTTKYHWPERESYGLVSACSGWQVVPTSVANPASVAEHDRCQAMPCRRHWQSWTAEPHASATAADTRPGAARRAANAEETAR